MKMVSIQDLKRHLSKFLALAASGTRVVVTRHKRPLAELGPAEFAHLHVGARFGRAKLRPAVREAATKGLYLRYLTDDRRGAAPER
jgi:prevent-host-death family protein